MSSRNASSSPARARESVRSATTAYSHGVSFLPVAVSNQHEDRPDIGGKAMAQHKVGTQEEWQAARDELLAEEKELTRRNDELARNAGSFPGCRSRRNTAS